MLSVVDHSAHCQRQTVDWLGRQLDCEDLTTTAWPRPAAMQEDCHLDLVPMMLASLVAGMLSEAWFVNFGQMVVAMLSP